MDLPAAIQQIRPCVVQITALVSGLPDDVWRKIGKPFIRGTLGTGFLVGEHYVVTALHVVAAGQTFLEGFEATDKSLSIGFAQRNTENMRGNFSLVGFDVVDTDERHDLALLKMHRNPFKGEVSSGIAVQGQPLQMDFAAAVLYPIRPVDGVAVAVSGFPLEEAALVTNAGCLASAWRLDTKEVERESGPPGFTVKDFADSYLADVVTNPGNSGGPVYLVENSSVIGVCVAGRLTQATDAEGQPLQEVLHSANLTIVVPTRYVVDLLSKHNVPFNASSSTPPMSTTSAC